MKFIHIIFCSLFMLQLLPVSSQNYSAILIPDSLRFNAKAVKRNEEITISIKSVSKAVIKKKFAYTILNEDGDWLSSFKDYYNQFSNIIDFKGTLYDEKGRKIESLKFKDLYDHSLVEGSELASDSRIKGARFTFRNYPYTVEFEVTKELNGIISLPHWIPIHDFGISVQNSSLVVESPADYLLRYKSTNYNDSLLIENTEPGKIKYKWEIHNLVALENEIWSPKLSEVSISVRIAPFNFDYGKINGSMGTWNDFGRYFSELNKGRDILPDFIKKDIHSLTDTLSTTKLKVAALYNYLQNNTRYISIQLGLGGLQPFDAKFVAEKKYGDCKALSNYMVSLLKETNIKSYYTLIAAGDDETRSLIEDFPNDYFNHVVVCVPYISDTIWLECTSQTNSLGYMGSFTGNRKSLLITEDGGYLVNTPRYGLNENTLSRTVIASINEDGKLIASVRTFFRGIEQELQHDIINYYTEDQKTKYLNKSINLPTYTIESNTYNELKNEVPEIEEKLKITAPNYATVSNMRLFVQPNIFNKISKIPTIVNRKFPIVIDESFKENDSIDISIPKGYSIESIPKDVVINNKFGSYKVHYEYNKDKIHFTRERIKNESTFPTSDYQDLYKYYETIYTIDRSKIVFIKK